MTTLHDINEANRARWNPDQERESQRQHALRAMSGDAKPKPFSESSPKTKAAVRSDSRQTSLYGEGHTEELQKIYAPKKRAKKELKMNDAYRPVNPNLSIADLQRTNDAFYSTDAKPRSYANTPAKELITKPTLKIPTGELKLKPKGLQPKDDDDKVVRAKGRGARHQKTRGGQVVLSHDDADIPHLGGWSMHAGGTSAAPGKHGYTHTTGEISKGGTQYSISPHSSSTGRHKGYIVSAFHQSHAHKQLGVVRHPREGVGLARQHQVSLTSHDDKVVGASLSAEQYTNTARAGIQGGNANLAGKMAAKATHQARIARAESRGHKVSSTMLSGVSRPSHDDDDSTPEQRIERKNAVPGKIKRSANISQERRNRHAQELRFIRSMGPRKSNATGLSYPGGTQYSGRSK